MHSAASPLALKAGLIAPLQVASYSKQQGFGLQVVGYYQANANLDDKDFGPVARKIADKIHQRHSCACALLVCTVPCVSCACALLVCLFGTSCLCLSAAKLSHRSCQLKQESLLSRKRAAVL